MVPDRPRQSYCCSWHMSRLSDKQHVVRSIEQRLRKSYLLYTQNCNLTVFALFHIELYYAEYLLL